MERNLQKGFAILLILCLLTSGVEGHDLAVTPDIKAKFADCVRMHPESALYSTYWHQSIDNHDVVICNTNVGMWSLGVCYDLSNEVYYLGSDRQNQPKLVYFVKNNLWYDRGEDMYFDVDTGLAYMSPTRTGRGVYVHLDAVAIAEYQRYVSDAYALISEFQREMNRFGWDVIRARVIVDDDKPISEMALPWGRI